MRQMLCVCPQSELPKKDSTILLPQSVGTAPAQHNPIFFHQQLSPFSSRFFCGYKEFLCSVIFKAKSQDLFTFNHTSFSVLFVKFQKRLSRAPLCNASVTRALTLFTEKVATSQLALDAFGQLLTFSSNCLLVTRHVINFNTGIMSSHSPPSAL